MLLSIVMMVKNEERYLDKTLKSLKPLMKDINSELIILDTGSDDSTVEIAKRYTDKVFFADWNNDFAHMRNISISYASGDWILILDADEQLTNYDKLKEFFNSDLCNKYNSACITLKNILSQDEESYSIAPMLRLFKNYDGFGYKGAIHEQPIFKNPIYNDIAMFNHYGYLFEDEEIKQLKDIRNKKILIEEVKKSPNDPYMNYQLGKNYIIAKEYEDALYYMEKAYDIYTKINYIPIFVTLDLASLYINLAEFNKCERLCTKYIKKDNKNIDIFYYLATSQKQLNKHTKSIENYKRYLYLIENYDITTQASNMECNFDTLNYKENCKINIIDSYYKLEMYEEVVKYIDDIPIKALEEAYLVIFMSLYKLNQIEKMIELYNNISKSKVQQNEFKIALESILTRVKEKDKNKIYKLFCHIDDNYGLLNKIRLGEKIDLEKYNEILKNEKEVYFGDCLYYALKQGMQIEKILDKVNYLNIRNYINYIIINKRDCIIDLYNYLENITNTLNINFIKIYSCLAKSLLLHGNLTGEKYEKLFFMYITYNYDYLKQLYNESLTDEELLDLLTDEDDIFTIKIIIIQKMKKNNELEYIKNMKGLLIENKKYKKSIGVLVENFKSEFNQNEELKYLKKQYKELIKNDVNTGDIINAQNKIDEYESIFGAEIDILNFKAIIKILNGDFISADKLLKNAYIIDKYNYDVIFNIAYVKQMLEEYEESVKFFNYIINYCDNDEIVLEAKEKIMNM